MKNIFFILIAIFLFMGTAFSFDKIQADRGINIVMENVGEVMQADILGSDSMLFTVQKHEFPEFKIFIKQINSVDNLAVFRKSLLLYNHTVLVLTKNLNIYSHKTLITKRGQLFHILC